MAGAGSSADGVIYHDEGMHPVVLLHALSAASRVLSPQQGSMYFPRVDTPTTILAPDGESRQRAETLPINDRSCNSCLLRLSHHTQQAEAGEDGHEPRTRCEGGPGAGSIAEVRREILWWVPYPRGVPFKETWG